MKMKILMGSTAAVGLLGLGMLVGGIVGASGAFAQTPTTPSAQATAVPSAPSTKPESGAPRNATREAGEATEQAALAAKAKITQQQAEQTALSKSPGNKVDHSSLQDENGTAVYDVDFANGGGVRVNAETGAVIATEAAGADQGGRGRKGGPGGRGADQAALVAKATVAKADAEKAALAASPGSTVDHSRLAGDPNGTVFWDVDFANGGGAQVNAVTGAIIATEAAGTDHPGGAGGFGGHGRGRGRPAAPATPPATQP